MCCQLSLSSLSKSFWKSFFRIFSNICFIVEIEDNKFCWRISGQITLTWESKYSELLVFVPANRIVQSSWRQSRSLPSPPSNPLIPILIFQGGTTDPLRLKSTNLNYVLILSLQLVSDLLVCLYLIVLFVESNLHHK